MYNIIISVIVAALISALLSLLPMMHIAFAILLGLAVGIVALVFLSKRIMKQIEPQFKQAQVHGEKRQFLLAIKVLESMLPLAKWQVMLKGQLYSQIGVFYFAQKNEDKAVDNLEKGSARSPDAQLILASIYFKKKSFEKVKSVLDITIKVNKKQVLLYNALAFMLTQSGAEDQAKEVLERCLKANTGNETTQDNLLRLQNGKKMNMKSFGMNWYSLQLERAPMSMMQGQFAGKAGFRQSKKMR